MLAAVALGACSSAAMPEPAQTGDHKPWPGSDYRQLVADNAFIVTLRKKTSYSMFEISDLRRSAGSEPGDWMTCLRTGVNGKLRYFGVFFKDFEVIDYRLSVVINRCEQEQYSPLPNATPPKKDVLPKG